MGEKPVRDQRGGLTAFRVCRRARGKIGDILELTDAAFTSPGIELNIEPGFNRQKLGRGTEAKEHGQREVQRAKNRK